MLSNTDITTRKVANAIGYNSGDVGTLCLGASNRDGINRINEYAKYRPFSCATVPRTDAIRLDRNMTWVKTDIVGWNSQMVKGVVPSFPTGGSNSPYCLGDFRGYNHGAKKFSVDGIPSELSMVWNATSVAFDYAIQLPECTPKQLIGTTAAKVKLSGRIYGTTHNTGMENEVGSIDWTEADCSKLKTGTATLSKGLPAGQGISVYKDIWVYLSTENEAETFWIEDVNKFKRTIKISKGFNPTPDMSDAYQWRALVDSSDVPQIVDSNGYVLTNTGIRFDRWEYFSGSNNYPDEGLRNGNSAFRVNGLFLPVSQMGEKIIQYYEGGIWKNYKTWGKNESFNGNLLVDGSSPYEFPFIKLTSGNKYAVKKFRIMVDNEL